MKNKDDEMRRPEGSNGGKKEQSTAGCSNGSSKRHNNKLPSFGPSNWNVPSKLYKTVSLDPANCYNLDERRNSMARRQTQTTATTIGSNESKHDGPLTAGSVAPATGRCSLSSTLSSNNLSPSLLSFISGTSANVRQSVACMTPHICAKSNNNNNNLAQSQGFFVAGKCALAYGQHHEDACKQNERLTNKIEQNMRCGTGDKDDKRAQINDKGGQQGEQTTIFRDRKKKRNQSVSEHTRASCTNAKQLDIKRQQLKSAGNNSNNKPLGRTRATDTATATDIRAQQEEESGQERARSSCSASGTGDKQPPSATKARRPTTVDVNFNNRKQLFDKQQQQHSSNAGAAAAAAAARHPLDAASLISKLFFGWMLPFIWQGWRHGLRRSDLPSQANEDERCDKIGKKLLAYWNKELESRNWRQKRPDNNGVRISRSSNENHKDNHKQQASREHTTRPSLTRAIARAHAKWILMNSLLTFFAEVVCKSLSAYSVGQMLLHITNRELLTSNNSQPSWSGANDNNNNAGFLLSSLLEEPLVFWTATLIVVSFCWVLSAHFYGFQMMRVGLHVRVGCSYLIYRKSLKLGQQKESSQATMGKMINLLSNDLDKFNYVCIMIPFLWVGPIQTIVSILLLWPTLGPSCLGSLFILLILTPIQFYLSGKFGSYRRRIAACTDERVRKLNETMMSLKLIRLYGWEITFREKLLKSRERETNLIHRVGIIKGLNAALMYTSSKLVLFVTIVFHCLIFNQHLDAKTLFMSMAMLNNVQFTMTQLMPRLVSLGGESLVSLRRIRDFLLTEEFEPSSKLWLEPIHQDNLSQLPSLTSNSARESAKQPSFWEMFDTSRLVPQAKTVEQNKALVHCQNMGAMWPQANAKTLEGISFKCETPDLIIIYGQVACGKTSLLMSLLNELSISDGTARVSGSISFSSQNPWIFTGTIRDNITFGSNFYAARYQRIIEICALQRDFNLLGRADLTYINEDSLSGGQKARINLARCLYRDCDIYMLDDPFSAIDDPVAHHIFMQAIKGFLCNKLVLLVTSKVQFLEKCDKVLLLDRGRQLAFCSYTEMRTNFLVPVDASSNTSAKQLNQIPLSSGALQMSTNIDVKIDKMDESSIFLENGLKKERSFVDQTNKQAQMFDNFCWKSDKENTEYKDFTSEQLKCSSANTPYALRANFPQANISDRASPNENVCLTSNFATCQDEVQAKKYTSKKFLSQTNLDKNLKMNAQASKSTESDSTMIEASEQQTISKSHASCGSRNCVGMKSKVNRAAIASSDDSSLITANKEELSEAGAIGCESDLSKRSVDNRISAEKTMKTEHNQALALTTAVTCLEVCSCPDLNNMDISCSLNTAGHNMGGALSSANHLEQLGMPTVKVVTAISGPNNCAKGNNRAHDRAEESSSLIDTRDQYRADSAIATKRGTFDGLGALRANDISCSNPGEINLIDAPEDEEDTSQDKKLPGLAVWIKYYAQSSSSRLVILIAAFLITQILFSFIDVYLTVWSITEQNRALLIEITETNEVILNNSRHEAFIHSGSDFSIATSRVSCVDMSSWAWNGGKSDLNNTMNGINARFTYDIVQNSSLGGVIQSVKISTSLPKASDWPETTTVINEILNSTKRLVYQGEDDDGKETDAELLYLDLQSIPTDSPESTVVLADSTDTSTHDAVIEEHRNVAFEIRDEKSNPALDQDIYDESEAALNVKSTYRPLYMLVNKLTPQVQAAIYALLLIMLFFCSAATNILSYSTSNKSAKKLYEKLVDSALFAKLSFFDSNPVGRFINRATRDIGIIDEAIPYNANQSYDALLQTAATFIVISAVDFRLAPLSLIILFVFLIYYSIHVKPTKDIQRMEGISRSPIISHISTTLAGLHTIRVTKSESRFEQTFMRHQDAHTSVFLFKLGCNRCMAVILDWLNASYIGIIAITAVTSGMNGPSAGLIITSAMLLCGLTQHGMMKLTETESLMTSVERVIEYCNLPQEECMTNRGRRRPNSVITKGCTAIWPSNGCLEFRNVDLYYNRNSSKPVLKNISFKVNAGEKIGIIGRTGAGKSSIITTLFRLYDYDGTILLDEVDIRSLNLFELRTSIGIIPQNPILFSTSIRENLDPMNLHDDFTLWSALDKANLRETINALPGKLNYDIGNGGLSTGQKQLICLARVLLRQNKLIVMDEATANVDPGTDASIQTTIRREFKHCTVITIAHRLETILDYDRVMVLEAGRIIDFDTPERLSAGGKGYFADLARRSGT